MTTHYKVLRHVEQSNLDVPSPSSTCTSVDEFLSETSEFLQAGFVMELRCTCWHSIAEPVFSSLKCRFTASCSRKETGNAKITAVFQMRLLQLNEA